MLKLNKHKNNIKKPYRDNVRLPLRMVIYKTVSREELTQYSKRDTNLAQNRYIKYADVDDEMYTVKNVQNNNNFVQTNINFDSAKSCSVHDMFNKPIKNKVNLQFENVISKNHSLKLVEKKIIQEINVYNAVDLLKINKHELYHQTKFEMNQVLFGLDEKISEDVEHNIKTE
ncbi:uncharacterized protein LOC132951120 isoform X2 [Metopolophium dirhodum]|uniref:uncharacterized protein LOC132951120 isoform X2 n=1 Tax=Metopolophium dirhodum TaxID=44670 RepID=UPI00298FA81F|nr:uncharacterized protein LOC132951120 isoform X2 [Metopolophium dirhodum]